MISPGVMVDVLGYEEAIYPYTYPTVIAMPITFIALFLFSVMDKSSRANAERSAFPEQAMQSELGAEIAAGKQH